MEKKNKSYLFWGGITIATIGLASAGYYLYNLLFADDYEISEVQKEKIEELKHQVEELNGELNMETAIRILAETNKIAEEMHKKNKPDLDEQRRNVVNQPEEYERICQEMFESKEIAYNDAMKKVLNNIENRVTFEDVHNLLSKVSPIELEKQAYKYEQPEFDGPYPEDEKIKEAYKFYGKEFQNEIHEFQRIMSTNQFDPGQDSFIFFRLLVHKTKVDDLLYLKYKLTEQQIRYLLHERNLLADPEIKALHANITRIDEMFTG